MSDGSDIDVLWRAARRLGRRAAVASPLPPVWFFTDPARTPEPERVAERLPRGAGVVYRAFGASDAVAQGKRLAETAGERGLILLVGRDPALAEATYAAGVHLPEQALGDAPAIRALRPDWVLTGAAHDRAALRHAERLGLAATFVSPVFASDSPSAGPPIGRRVLARWAHEARTPVYALGGVNSRSVWSLRETGVAGVAAVGALVA